MITDNKHWKHKAEGNQAQRNRYWFTFTNPMVYGYSLKSHTNETIKPELCRQWITNYAYAKKSKPSRVVESLRNRVDWLIAEPTENPDRVWLGYQNCKIWCEYFYILKRTIWLCFFIPGNAISMANIPVPGLLRNWSWINNCKNRTNGHHNCPNWEQISIDHFASVSQLNA